MSKGEEKISNLLRKQHIFFIKEKTFSDLKHGLLRFDFYIPNYNNKQIAIEFQGRQHYEFVSKFHSNRSDLLKQQNNDRRKISYCLANNILIYCIPFWELDNLNSYKDCFNNKFLACSRWKNDDDWKRHKDEAS